MKNIKFDTEYFNKLREIVEKPITKRFEAGYPVVMIHEKRNKRDNHAVVKGRG